MGGTTSTYLSHSACLDTVLCYMQGGQHLLKGFSTQPGLKQLLRVCGQLCLSVS